MIKPTKRATIYLETALHQALKIRAAEMSRSVSELVNDAIRHELAEDLEDIEAFKERLHEPRIPYEQVLKELRADGKI